MFNKSIKFLFCALAFSMSFFSFAQPKGLSVELEQHIGWLIPEYSFIKQYANSNTFSTAINIKQQSYGANDFEADFKFPQKGLRLQYSTLGNSEKFGNAFSASYFFQASLLRKKRFLLDNRTGFGLGYITRKHDFTSNTQNIAIGSHLNFYFHTQFGTTILLPKWQFSAGLYFDHYSNANAASPNIGLNNFGIYTSISRQVTEYPEFTEENNLKHKNDWTHQLYLCLGAKHTRAFLDNYFFTSSITYDFGYHPKKWYKISIGADLFYDSSVPSYLKAENQTSQFNDSFQTGIHIGNMFIYRKFLFGIDIGHHVLLPNKIHSLQFYSRGYVGYQITSHLSFRLAMKSQLHILDYPEFAFGWKF